jgi:hypothetical protein
MVCGSTRTRHDSEPVDKLLKYMYP